MQLKTAIEKRYRRIRRMKGLSLREQARDLEVSHMTLRRWMQGTSLPQPSHVGRIAQYLGVQPATVERWRNEQRAKAEDDG